MSHRNIQNKQFSTNSQDVVATNFRLRYITATREQNPILYRIIQANNKKKNLAAFNIFNNERDFVKR